MILAMTSPRWLSRYHAGQREQVWQELHQLGRAIRQMPDLAEEAQLVCDEMARLARQNIEVIIERLTADGYRFHTNDYRQLPMTPHFAPTATATEHADWLQNRFGDIPMTLRSWIRLAGDVWLVGTHPEWPTSAYADPLVIQVEGVHNSQYWPSHPPIRQDFEDEWASWREHSIHKYFVDEWAKWRKYSATSDVGQFVLPLAPDQVHKGNESGGDPQGIVLPDGYIDGLFFDTNGTVTPFVSYLNHVFQHGGFPGQTRCENGLRIKHNLAKDLLPL
jgi:hypothetical protein